MNPPLPSSVPGLASALDEQEVLGMPVSTAQFRLATPSDAEPCYLIEISAYEGDEAATLSKIALRIAQYPQGFLVIEKEGAIIGFINSGCAHEVVMSDESFKELVGHDADALNVVIMSVVIDPVYQGKGYARLLMQQFVEKMKGLGKQTIHLMCKERHVGLYERMGYRYVRPSASDHGGMTWHEMVMDLVA
jgi:GNAT superfamily N-acetyltransferase